MKNFTEQEKRFISEESLELDCQVLYKKSRGIEESFGFASYQISNYMYEEPADRYTTIEELETLIEAADLQRNIFQREAEKFIADYDDYLEDFHLLHRPQGYIIKLKNASEGARRNLAELKAGIR